MGEIKLNKTNQVVRQATKIAARDIRTPKVVREGKVLARASKK